MKLPFRTDLSDKIVAITGAGGVLCSAFAKALAACGAKVALLDIREDRAAAFAAEIGESAMAVRCNCLDRADIEAARNLIQKKWGPVNLLVNGASGIY